MTGRPSAEEYEGALLRQKTVLEARLAAYLNPNQIGEGYEPDQIRSALTLNGHRHNSIQVQLNAVNDALQRIREGIYGVCVDCGVVIPEERLSVILFASRCCSCQSTHDIRTYGGRGTRR